MIRSLVLSILSKDKPGIVESLAAVIAKHNGNWTESKLMHLGGQFAGILRIDVDENKVSELELALKQLDTSGIHLMSADATDASNEASVVSKRFQLTGHDKHGIVRELANAFASRNINVEELETGCSSMPWSGDPMFTAVGTVSIPENIDIAELEDKLFQIADELGVDIEMDEVTDNT